MSRKTTQNVARFVLILVISATVFTVSISMSAMLRMSRAVQDADVLSPDIATGDMSTDIQDLWDEAWGAQYVEYHSAFHLAAPIGTDRWQVTVYTAYEDLYEPLDSSAEYHELGRDDLDFFPNPAMNLVQVAWSASTGVFTSTNGSTAYIGGLLASTSTVSGTNELFFPIGAGDTYTAVESDIAAMVAQLSESPPAPSSECEDLCNQLNTVVYSNCFTLVAPLIFACIAPDIAPGAQALCYLAVFATYLECVNQGMATTANCYLGCQCPSQYPVQPGFYDIYSPTVNESLWPDIWDEEYDPQAFVLLQPDTYPHWNATAIGPNGLEVPGGKFTETVRYALSDYPLPSSQMQQIMDSQSITNLEAWAVAGQLMGPGDSDLYVSGILSTITVEVTTTEHTAIILTPVSMHVGSGGASAAETDAYDVQQKLVPPEPDSNNPPCWDACVNTYGADKNSCLLFGIAGAIGCSVLPPPLDMACFGTVLASLANCVISAQLSYNICTYQCTGECPTPVPTVTYTPAPYPTRTATPTVTPQPSASPQPTPTCIPSVPAYLCGCVNAGLSLEKCQEYSAYGCWLTCATMCKAGDCDACVAARTIAWSIPGCGGCNPAIVPTPCPTVTPSP